MKIKDLDDIIRKVPLSKRLKACQIESYDRIGANSPIILSNESHSNRPSNYELELIAFRSIINSPCENYRERKSNWLFEATKLLRNNDFFNAKNISTDEIFSRLLFLQMEPQINYNIFYYRYNYFFNFESEQLDMKEEFFNKFGVNYKSFVNISFFTLAFAQSLKDDSFNFALELILDDEDKIALKCITSTPNKLLEKHEELVSRLSESRNEFFDLNLLSQFPIVDYMNQRFIPYIPYIPYACTRSLMFRLTENNDALRQKIGKSVLENYLEYLVMNSEVTNKFRHIKEFKYSKNNKDSSDLMIHSDDELIFIEAKLFNQSLKLRSLEVDEITKSHERVSDAIVQILRNIVDMKNGEMNEYLSVFELNKTYGIVVLYDEFYFNYNETYQLAYSKSKDKGYDFTRKQIEDMIKIYSLTMLENNLNIYGGHIFQLLNGLEMKSPVSRLLNFEAVCKSLISHDEEEIKKRVTKNKVLMK